MTKKEKHDAAQLLVVDELIAKLETSQSVEPRPSTAANIRALKKERRTMQAVLEIQPREVICSSLDPSTEARCQLREGHEGEHWGHGPFMTWR